MKHREGCPEMVGAVSMCTCLVRADYETRLRYVSEGGCALWWLGPRMYGFCHSDVCCVNATETP